MLEVIYNEMYGVCQPDGLIPDWISNYFYKNHDDIMSDGFCCKLYVSQYQFIDDLIIFLKLTEYYTPHVKFFYHERGMLQGKTENGIRLIFIPINTEKNLKRLSIGTI